MQQPTVYLVIAGEAITFTPSGEIATTQEWNAFNEPIWDEYGLADDRGAGGAEGYRCLGEALEWAEENAKLCGLEINRIKL